MKHTNAHSQKASTDRPGSGAARLRRCTEAAALAALLLLVPTICGCRTWAVMFGEDETKNVSAAYPYLAGQKVCILVRADMETLFEYRHLPLELADYVRVALEANVRGVTVVSPREVVDYQNRNPGWEREDPARMGQRFSADRALEINVTQYTTREPDSPHLYRGHVTATLCVYNTQYPDSRPAFTTEVKIAWPEKSMGELGVGDREVRRGMMEAFAQEVAGQFYDRKVKVK